MRPQLLLPAPSIRPHLPFFAALATGAALCVGGLGAAAGLDRQEAVSLQAAEPSASVSRHPVLRTGLKLPTHEEMRELDLGLQESPALPRSAAAEQSPLPVGVELNRARLAESIRGREPVGEDAVFAAGGRVYFFAEFANLSGEAQEVEVRWARSAAGSLETLRDGSTRLEVGALPRYRTRAYRTIREPGEYVASLHAEDGSLLRSFSFEVLESELGC